MEKRDADNKPEKSKKRRSGAQPGNNNARKHGFYSSYLPPAERRKLREASGLQGLQHEMELLRVKLGAMASNPDVTISQMVSAVTAIARVAAADHRISVAEEGNMTLAESLAGVLRGIGVPLGLGEFYDDAERRGRGGGGRMRGVRRWGSAPLAPVLGIRWIPLHCNRNSLATASYDADPTPNAPAVSNDVARRDDR